MKNNSLKNGFTLIELIVVIAVIAVAGAMGISSYGALGNQKKLENDFRKVQDVLDIAKTKATSGDGVTACESSGYAYLYGVKFSIINVSGGLTQYQIALDCTNTIDVSGTISSPLSTYYLDSKDTVISPFVIEFRPNGSAELVGSTIPLKIYSSSSGKYKCINVSSRGLISEYEGVCP